VSTKRTLVRELAGPIDSQGRALHGPLIDRPSKNHLLNERDVMTKLITSLVFAVAAALAAPAMAASHTGGAPMKAGEPAATASAPAKKHKKTKTEKTAKHDEMKKEDAAKK
jgi:hypothetical protein